MPAPWYPGSPPPGFNTHYLPDGSEWYASQSAEITGNVRIGRFSYVGYAGVINGAPAGIDIGAFTSIAPHFYCDAVEEHYLQYPTAYPLTTVLGMDLPRGVIDIPQQPTRIGSDVWIGSHVKISAGRGLNIGHGAILGTRSLVQKDCEPFGIYVGTPARLVRFRFADDMIAQLLDLAWWDWRLDKIMRNKDFFAIDLTQYRGRLSDEVKP